MLDTRACSVDRSLSQPGHCAEECVVHQQHRSCIFSPHGQWTEGRSNRLEEDFSLLSWRVQQLKSIIHNLPEAIFEWEVIVHQVDQVVVVMDVLDDHARGRLLFIELGPLLDPQRKGLVLPRERILAAM